MTNSDHCPRCGGGRQTLPCPVCEPNITKEQIAQEAAVEINKVIHREIEGDSLPGAYTAIILAAIEKATEDAYETGYNVGRDTAAQPQRSEPKRAFGNCENCGKQHCAIWFVGSKLLCKKCRDAASPASGAASSEPKEWTGEHIRTWMGNEQSLADAINAAIADIVSAAQMANTLNGAHIKQLERQLAAERERRKQAEQDHQDFRTYWLKLAGVHGCDSVTDAFVQLKQERSKVLQLESFGEQLADCQSSRKGLVEALEEAVEAIRFLFNIAPYSKVPTKYMPTRFDAVLASVKEGK